MTRENKLALVIGFALILFVGVLVSDHFSAAANERAADFSSGERTLVASRDARILELLPLAKEQPVDPGPSFGKNDEPSSGMVDASVPGATPLIGDWPPTQGDVPEGFTVVHARPEKPLEHITMGQAEERFGAPGGASPSVIFHDVQKGQTLYSICKEHYGSADLMKELARYNGVGDPSALAAGRRLRIPSAEALGGNPSSFATRPVSAGASGVPASTYATYTVKPSDTLTRIARKVLGSSARVQELIDLNRDVLDDPDHLTVGTRLRVPVATARSSG